MTRDPAPLELAPLGDGAILITLGDTIERAINQRVHACVSAITDAMIAGVVDIVPAYASLAVHYDASVAEAQEILGRLRDIASSVAPGEIRPESSVVTIPVRYDGPDLTAVADATGLAPDEVVARHSAVEYFVYMPGFAPGFAYLGDLDPALQLPRRETPRTRVPRGSVAIAGLQTAVYPHETPGGWHLIGRTDLLLFDLEQDPPALLRAGDRVRFEPVA
ncbi:MAG: 5-oxoprolinase subunit PxpB [Gemmatimonadaceae bacterium]|nr:5-oxoprolinase subunit PxpB [Gemmatimonadaceae bacterium]